VCVRVCVCVCVYADIPIESLVEFIPCSLKSGSLGALRGVCASARDAIDVER